MGDDGVSGFSQHDDSDVGVDDHAAMPGDVRDSAAHSSAPAPSGFERWTEPMISLAPMDLLWLPLETARLVLRNCLRITFIVLVFLAPAALLARAGAPFSATQFSLVGVVLFVGLLAASNTIYGGLLLADDRHRAQFRLLARRNLEEAIPLSRLSFVLVSLASLAMYFGVAPAAWGLAIVWPLLSFPFLAGRHRHFSALKESAICVVQTLVILIAIRIFASPLFLVFGIFLAFPPLILAAVADTAGFTPDPDMVGLVVAVATGSGQAFALVVLLQLPTVAYRRMAMGRYQDRGSFFP